MEINGDNNDERHKGETFTKRGEEVDGVWSGAELWVEQPAATLDLSKTASIPNTEGA